MDAKGEVLITIMASYQQESESISRNIKICLQYRYQCSQAIVNPVDFSVTTKTKKTIWSSIKNKSRSLNGFSTNASMGKMRSKLHVN
nr:hypothetical protein [Ligilactobacillus ruminis]